MAYEVTYTWAEMEAYHLMVAAGQLPEEAGSGRDLIREAAEKVIALAERIKSRRAVVAMKR